MLGNQLYKDLVKFVECGLIEKEDEVFYFGDYYIDFEENKFVIIREKEFDRGNIEILLTIHIENIEEFSLFIYFISGKKLLNILINEALDKFESSSLLERNLFELGVKFISQEFFQPTLNSRGRELKYQPIDLYNLCHKEITKDLELVRENRAIYQARFEQVNSIWKKVNVDLHSKFNEGIGELSFENYFTRNREIF